MQDNRQNWNRIHPFGDALGVGPGRNWAHVNSIAYDAKD